MVQPFCLTSWDKTNYLLFSVLFLAGGGAVGRLPPLSAAQPTHAAPVVPAGRRAAARAAHPAGVRRRGRLGAGEDGSRPGAARRLWLDYLLLQAPLADKLREHFPGRPARTFALCDTVLTQRLRLTSSEALRMEPRHLWSRVAAELRSTSIDLATTKVLAFLASSGLDGAGAGGHVWQGGGGLALYSAAGLFPWPRSVAEIGRRFANERSARRRPGRTPPAATPAGRASARRSVLPRTSSATRWTWDTRRTA